MNLDQFVAKTFKPENGYCFRKRIICNDGFSMSVQGSSGHYCTPRETVDCYYAMEIGYPSKREKLILEYAENKKSPTGTVYGYVPTHVIQAVIDKHKGIDEVATFAIAHQ